MDKTLISILGGLGGMFGWGTSDFLANRASDKIGHFKTFFWSQVVGFALFVAAILIIRPVFLVEVSLIPFLVIASIGYAVGYLLFYKAFEVGSVSVVSSVINLNTLLTMGVAIILFRQMLDLLQSVGVGLAIIGVILVAVNFRDFLGGKASIVKGVKEAVLASILFGLFYWPVNEFLTERADWLVVSTIIKAISLLIIILISVVKRTELKINKISSKVLFMVFFVGILEAVGILSTSFGVSVGDSVLVAPIASGLTIVTVILAVIFLKEKLTKLQSLGILMTVGGIILTAF